TEKTPPVSRNVAALQEALRLSAGDFRRGRACWRRPGSVARPVGRRRWPEVGPDGTSANQRCRHCGNGMARRSARQADEPAAPSTPTDATPQLKRIIESDATPRRVQPHFLAPTTALGKYER